MQNHVLTASGFLVPALVALALVISSDRLVLQLAAGISGVGMCAVSILAFYAHVASRRAVREHG